MKPMPSAGRGSRQGAIFPAIHNQNFAGGHHGGNFPVYLSASALVFNEDCRLGRDNAEARTAPEADIRANHRL